MLEIEKFERENPELVPIETMGRDLNSVIIFRNLMDGQYYAKGPFGSEMEICYISLGSDLSTDSKQALLSEWRRKNQRD